jgi:hypothetical protein
MKPKQMSLFKTLSPEEIVAFQKWARENYISGSPINGVWHPVIQRECVRMNEEAYREQFLRSHMQDNKADLL